MMFGSEPALGAQYGPARKAGPVHTVVSDAGPLCWGQKRFWDEQQKSVDQRPAGTLLSWSLDIPGIRLSMTEVRSAFRILLSRHEILRTTFPASDSGAGMQVVWPVEAEKYDLMDSTSPPSGLTEASRAEIDIAERWPFVATVSWFADQETGRTGTSIALQVHHIAADMTGADVLDRELRSIIEASRSQRDVELPDLGMRPLDLARLEASSEGSRKTERAITYWTRHSDAMRSTLAALASSVRRDPGEVKICRAVSSESAAHVRTLAATLHVGSAAVVSAAIAMTFARAVDVDCFAGYLAVSNRHLPGLRSTVCSIVQNGLLVVEGAQECSLHQVIRRSSAGLLRGTRYAHFDEEQMLAAREAQGAAFQGQYLRLPTLNVTKYVRSAQTTPPPSAGDHRSFRRGPISAETWSVPHHGLGVNFYAGVSDTELTVVARVAHQLFDESASEALAFSVHETLASMRPTLPPLTGTG
jgi:hypothetical protein